MVYVVVVVVVIPDTFQEMGARRNSAETQYRVTPPLGLDIWPYDWTRHQKWKKLCQRWGAREAQMQDNPKGRELDPAGDVCRESR